MIKPHGSDTLNPLYVADDAARAALLAEAETLPSLLLNSAAAANAVMMAGGYFNPLTGYMNKADALSVAKDLKTADGLFWPVPVMNLTKEAGIATGKLALRDPNVDGNPILAVMDVEAVETVSDEELKVAGALKSLSERQQRSPLALLLLLLRPVGKLSPRVLAWLNTLGLSDPQRLRDKVLQRLLSQELKRALVER